MANDQRLSELLLRWEELGDQDQPVTPEDLCADCPELLDELRQRIESLQSMKMLLETPAPEANQGLYSTVVGGTWKDSGGGPPAPPAGAGIPGYEILGELGRGGMGVVYKARHVQLKRLVAVKMILSGAHADPGELARFRLEAEAVARLQHPHIVQIHEIGEVEGRPFFSLEFVAGGSLAQKLAGTPLPPGEAARLTHILAGALHHAHEHGIIHRDLKPANVLLTAEGTAKVTDFGLARKLDEIGQTQSGAVMGTPSYMAPEQAAGQTRALGPAVDVYALGAILYDMLTGRPPFKGASLLETLEQVCHRDPVPPGQLVAKLPRDLETICLKCLQKEPRKRYASARDLAEDVQRFLDGRPILARPTGMAEKALKWLRRRPMVAGLLAAVFLVTVLGIAAFAWAFDQALEARDDAVTEKNTTALALRETEKAREQAEADRKQAEGDRKRVEEALSETEKARQHAKENEQKAKENEKKANEALTETKKQRKAADAEKLRAERVREFLASLFITNDPTGLTGSGLLPAAQSGKDVTAREILAQGRKSIDKLQADPLTQAALLDTIGDVSRSLGDYDQALPMLQRAYELRQKHLEPDHLDLAASLLHLGNWYAEKGYVDRAERYYLEAFALHEKRKTIDTLEAAEVQLRIAGLLASIGGEPGAEKWARAGLETRRTLLGPQHRDTAVGKMVLAGSLLDQGKFAEAAPLVAEALEYLQQAGGKEKGGFIGAISDYQQATLAMNLGFYETAETLYRKVVMKFQKSLGKDHPYHVLPLADLGSCLLKQQKKQEAEKVLLDALEIARKSLGLGHPRANVLVVLYADMMADQQRVPEGQAIVDEMLASQEERFGKASRWRLRTLAAAGQYAADTKQILNAEKIARELTTLLDERQTPMSQNDAIDLGNFADALGNGANLAVLSKLYQAIFRHHQMSPHPTHLVDYANYGTILTRRGRHQDAIAFLSDALKKAKEITPRTKGDMLDSIGMAHWSLGNFQEAEKALVGAVASDQRYTHRLIALFVQQGRRAEALEHVLKYQQRKISSVEKAWAVHHETMLRQLLGTFNRDNTAAKLNKLSDGAKSFDVASYRARAFASEAGPAVAREADLLKSWCHPGSKQPHPFLARALCLSRTQKDNEVLTVLKEMPTSTARVTEHLRTTLHGLAQFRLENTAATRKTMEKAVDLSENFLLSMARLRNPNLGGYLTSLQLELTWVCANIRKDYFDPIAQFERTLMPADLRDRITKYPSHVHEVRLEADSMYTIDLKSGEFDTYLRLENLTGIELAKDDDSGGDLHARITFRPSESATYRIIATSYNGKTGAYQLRVLRAKN